MFFSRLFRLRLPSTPIDYIDFHRSGRECNRRKSVEVGGDPMDKDAADLFFQAVSACSGRSAMLITGFLSQPFAAFICSHLRLAPLGSDQIREVRKYGVL